MPITVTAPRGVLTATGEQTILPRLTAALAQASGQADNAGFIQLIGGTVHLLDAQAIYAGGVNHPVVMVELKLPNIGLPDVAARAAFIETATDIVDELTQSSHHRGDTWVNILNAPDGGWGLGGKAYTGRQLLAALAG